MSKTRSTNNNKKAEPKEKKEKPTAWSSEQVETHENNYSIKFPIHIHKDRLEILYSICRTTDTFPQHYLEQALYEKIDSDLHNPQEIGQAFCDNILEYWKSNNNTNDRRALQHHTRHGLFHGAE